MSDSAAARVWDAMGSAGSAAAQSGLRKLIAMPQWSEEQRRSQMISLSMVERLTGETLSYLRERFEDAEQHTQARYGYGTSIHNLRESDPAAAEAAFGELSEALKATRSEDTAVELLRAVGNAGMPQGVALAQQFVRSDNAALRSAAAEAVRLAPGHDADRMLAGMMEAEPNDFVRADVMRAFMYRAPTEGALALLTETARNDASMVARQAAISTLNAYASSIPALQKLVDELIALNTPT